MAKKKDTKPPKKEAEAPALELPSLGELAQEALAACSNPAAYRQFVRAPMKDAAAYLAFLVVAFALATTLFMAIDIFRQVGVLINAREVIPEISLRNGDVRTEAPLPYSETYDDGSRRLAVAITNGGESPVDTNMVYFWLDGESIHTNFLGPTIAYPIEELNVTLTPAFIAERAHQWRLEQIVNALVISFVSVLLNLALLIGIGLAALTILFTVTKISMNPQDTLKICIRAITPAVLFVLFLSISRLYLFLGFVPTSIIAVGFTVMMGYAGAQAVLSPLPDGDSE